MRKRRLLTWTLCLCLTTTAAEAARRRAVVHPRPPEGPCRVQGLANFFYSTDGGQTWSQNAQPPTQAGAWDIAVLEGDPETLVTVVQNRVYDSNDAGCTWTLRYTITEQIKHTVHIAAGGAGRAFIWTEEFVLRYDHGVVTLLALPQQIGGLGVDPGNDDHVHVLDLFSGTARESFDGGLTWQTTGGSAGGTITSVAYDPADFRHILAGIQASGIRISRDGGRTWSIGPAKAPCTMAFVAGQPNVVWLTHATQPGQSWIQRSSDGGVHLEPIGEIAGVENGVCLAVLANPHDANVAFIPFRDLYTVDAARRSVTASTCCGGRMDRIAFSPSNPARVYVYSALR